jgi:N utilization substance protein B
MTQARSGSRRQARVYALQALYQIDIGQVLALPGLNALWATLVDGEGVDGERAPEADEVEFAHRVVGGVEQHREAIDAMIESCSTNWRLRRMPVVDRNILRLAAFELMHCPDIPGTVSVNEAIELAKLFGAEDTRSFVNGIVDRMGRQLHRLGEPGGRRRRDGV